MKHVRVLFLGLLLAGCSNDPDDRAFFNHGWVHPHRDLDLDMDPTSETAKQQMPRRAHPDRYPTDPFVD